MRRSKAGKRLQKTSANGRQEGREDGRAKRAVSVQDIGAQHQTGTVGNRERAKEEPVLRWRGKGGASEVAKTKGEYAVPVSGGEAHRVEKRRAGKVSEKIPGTFFGEKWVKGKNYLVLTRYC